MTYSKRRNKQKIQLRSLWGIGSKGEKIKAHAGRGYWDSSKKKIKNKF